MPGVSTKDKFKYLEVTTSRDGNQQYQLHIVFDIVGKGARILLDNHFTSYHNDLYLTLNLIPKLLYIFASISCSSKQCQEIELKINPHAIANMGV